jgi:hypothetical protein
VAEEMDFMVDLSDSNHIVLGFSMDGNEIPTGNDVLTILSYTGGGQASASLSEAIIISGYEDAQCFEVSHGENYIILVYMKGDVNLDETLDILDVVIVMNIIFEYITPTDYQLWAADYNDDSVINIMDIDLIINCILYDDCAGSDSPGVCIDYDGNVYETIQIGDQLWMVS